MRQSAEGCRSKCLPLVAASKIQHVGGFPGGYFRFMKHAATAMVAMIATPTPAIRVGNAAEDLIRSAWAVEVSLNPFATAEDRKGPGSNLHAACLVLCDFGCRQLGHVICCIREICGLVRLRREGSILPPLPC